ncbi:CybS-domain-containing protein [Neocallimastix sp. 'constans']|jgi:hypothetical protein
MEIFNSKCKVSDIKKFGKTILSCNIINQNRALNIVSKNVHLTFLTSQNQKYLLNNPSEPLKSIKCNSEIYFNTKKSLSYLIQNKINGNRLSSELIKTKIVLKDIKNNYTQSNFSSTLVKDIIKKNALNNFIINERIISKSQFHSGTVLKDQDDDMPKFRDSREKKEYIKLATKRNDIAAKGRMEGSYHWALSKIVIAGILGCVVASGIIGHHMFIDVLLGVLLPMHVYYTFQDLIYDYIPSRRYPSLNKYLIWVMRIITVIGLFSMFKFNTEDIGISDAAKQAWKAAKTHKPDEELKDEDIYYDSN